MPNRRVRLSLAGASLALLALGACVPRAAPPAPLPASAPAPRPVPAPPAAPAAPAPAPADWETAPLSPGVWHFTPSNGPSTATLQSGRMGLMIRCQQHSVFFAVLGTQGSAMVIRTSFGARRLAGENGEMSILEVGLAATDPLLDQMAFSRGRFLVTVEGGGALVVPAWPEVARVIEDCRGQ